MGKICVECEDPSWTGQDPIVAPELPSDGGGVKVVDELPEKGQKGMAYVLVDDLDNPTSSQGIFVYDEGWLLTAQPVSEAVQKVDELPEEGQPGVLYYVPKTGDDIYDLYRWVDDSWIKVDVDVKLYSGTGQNTDGAMTQKAVTDELTSIRGQLGKPKVITTADYNFDSDNDGVNDCFALWLVEPGIYELTDYEHIYVQATNSHMPSSEYHLRMNGVIIKSPNDNYDGDPAQYKYYIFGSIGLVGVGTGLASSGTDMGWDSLPLYNSISSEFATKEEAVGHELNQWEYDWNFETQTTADPNSKALWLLEDGLYKAGFYQDNDGNAQNYLLATSPSGYEFHALTNGFIRVVSHSGNFGQHQGCIFKTVLVVSENTTTEYSYNYNYSQTDEWEKTSANQFANSQSVNYLSGQIDAINDTIGDIDTTLQNITTGNGV